MPIVQTKAPSQTPINRLARLVRNKGLRENADFTGKEGAEGVSTFWGVFASTCARVERGEHGGGASRSLSLMLCGESPRWAQLPILSTVTVPFSSLAPETIPPCLPVRLHTKSPVMRQTLGVN